MLDAPHMAALTTFAAGLRAENEAALVVPNFDPLDGGAEAEALFLLEKPGPGAARTGFISRDNDDPTAEAILRFSAEAGPARERTLLWNIVPWWNGTTAVTGSEVRSGLAALPGLIRLLPGLRAVVLVGRRAAAARELFGPKHRVWETAHPSPNVRAAFPERWRGIPRTWQEVRTFLDQPP